MPQQSFNGSLDLSSPHWSVGIAKNPHGGSLDDPIAETPPRRRRLRPPLCCSGLDAIPRQVQNGLKP